MHPRVVVVGPTHFYLKERYEKEMSIFKVTPHTGVIK